METQKIIQIWSRIREGLLETIAKYAEDDLDYVPYNKGYSVRQLILHIAQEEYGEVHYGLTRKLNEFPPPFPEEEYPSIESMKSLLNRVHSETILFINSLADDGLEHEYEAQWGETRPLFDFLFHVLEHEIHHRGELSLILGLLGREGLNA